MRTGRRGVGGAIVRVVLAGAILAWPLPMSAAQQVAPDSEVAGQGGGELTGPGAQVSPTLIDPATGQVIAADAVPAGSRVVLPPGDIAGAVLEADGTTPHAGVKVTLIDANTGEEIASTTTDDEGKFLLKDVPEGLYVVHVGNPGIGAILQVIEGAEAALLSIVLPEAALYELPSWAPQWMQAYPVLAVGVLAGGIVMVVTASYVFVVDEQAQEVRISPITP